MLTLVLFPLASAKFRNAFRCFTFNSKMPQSRDADDWNLTGTLTLPFAAFFEEKPEALMAAMSSWFSTVDNALRQDRRNVGRNLRGVR
jgi:hypothetical protein